MLKWPNLVNFWDNHNVDDDSVKEMVDLTGLYKYINSQSLMMVSHFLNYKSIGNPWFYHKKYFHNFFRIKNFLAALKGNDMLMMKIGMVLTTPLVLMMNILLSNLNPTKDQNWIPPLPTTLQILILTSRLKVRISMPLKNMTSSLYKY